MFISSINYLDRKIADLEREAEECKNVRETLIKSYEYWFNQQRECEKEKVHRV